MILLTEETLVKAQRHEERLQRIRSIAERRQARKEEEAEEHLSENDHPPEILGHDRIIRASESVEILPRKAA